MSIIDRRAAARRRRLRRVTIGVLAVGIAAACAAAALATGQSRRAVGPSYKVAGTFGKEGTGAGQFSTNVTGLAVDKAGNVYVSDGNLSRVVVFSAKGSYLRSYPMVAGEGTTFDVAVGPTGDVWATTDTGAVVRRFPKAGGAPETLGTPKSADGVAVDADGNVYVSTSGDNVAGVVRFAKTAAGWDPAAMWVGKGVLWPIDVETSPDGTVYVADVKGAPPNVKHYDANGRLLKRINMKMQATAGAGVTLGIGVDPDCNVWAVNNAERNIMLYSPTGKLLATATSGDMVAKDVAVGPNGDVYAFDINTRKIVRFAPDRAKHATASVGGNVAVSGGIAKVKFTLGGVACPAQVAATASLKGAVNGKAAVQVPAGRPTVLSIPAKGTSGKATFTIVLKTNGRPTTQVASVNVSVR